MGYDYRSYLNTIISLLEQILSAFNAFVVKFDSAVSAISSFWQRLLDFLPPALFFLLLLVSVQFILRLYFPRWRDV